MPDTPSLTVVKSFDYRGVPEEWSNTYHFSGTTPANATAWRALAEAVWNEERKMLPSSVKLTASYGYVAGNESSVAQENFLDTPPANTSGLLATAGQAPGDVAFWIRWKTPDRNSKGRPIYLRKYFHAPILAGVDGIATSTRTAATAYAAKMTDGTLPGGFKVCGPQGAVAGASQVPTFVTTRTLKRRGSNPS